MPPWWWLKLSPLPPWVSNYEFGLGSGCVCVVVRIKIEDDDNICVRGQDQAVFVFVFVIEIYRDPSLAVPTKPSWTLYMLLELNP
nr:hypothetical protein CFP56_64805 [Quercus suber]